MTDQPENVLNSISVPVDKDQHATETSNLSELIAEKRDLDPQIFRYTVKLLENEIEKVENNGVDCYLIDLNHCVPIRIIVKVDVPSKEFPEFNFVGRILGPKALTMKRMVDDTHCRFKIQGRGSMRDKDEEERLRLTKDPKYNHLFDDLHVEIETVAEPPEAFARISLALAILKKLLVPDENVHLVSK